MKLLANNTIYFIGEERATIAADDVFVQTMF